MGDSIIRVAVQSQAIFCEKIMFNLMPKYLGY